MNYNINDKLMSNVDILRWLNNENETTCIDFNYAKKLIDKLNIQSKVEIHDELTHRVMRDNFCPGSGIKWYLLNDPIMDFFFFKHKFEQVSTVKSNCTYGGIEFEEDIINGLTDIAHDENISICDLEDVDISDRICKTLSALENGIDIIFNGLLVGPKNGIYGSPDIIIKKKYLYILDIVLNIKTDIEECINGITGGDEYTVIEIKYTKLKGNNRFQFTSKLMKYYRGQAHLYAIALKETLNLDYIPESFVMPSEIVRSSIPEMHKLYGNIIYRNYSCIPVDQCETHEPVMEAISWNSFISKYVHDIHPLMMFISNTNRHVNEYSIVKTLHCIEFGAIEYVTYVDKAVELRKRGILSIFDNNITSGELARCKYDDDTDPMSIHKMYIDELRFDVIKSKDFKRSKIYIPSRYRKLFINNRTPVIVYYHKDIPQFIIDGMYMSDLDRNINYDNHQFICYGKTDCESLFRDYGDIIASSNVLDIMNIVKDSIIAIPWLFNYKPFDMSYALYRNDLTNTYIDYITENEEDQLRNNVRCIEFIWRFLGSYVM